MKILTSLFVSVCIPILVTSCTDLKKHNTDSQISFALNWSNEIKEKIAKDANITPDSTKIDSSLKYIKITTYKKGIRLKNIGIDRKTMDTVYMILYSKNQKFNLVKEFCLWHPTFNVEVISYGNSENNHTTIGLHQFNYCKGGVMKRGFEYNNTETGVWEEYDKSGKLLKKTDYGNMDKLDSALHTLKY